MGGGKCGNVIFNVVILAFITTLKRYLETSLTHKFLAQLHLNVSQVASLTWLSACKGRQELFAQQAPEVLTTLKQVALVESNESSNRLEGIAASSHKIRNIVLRDARPANRSEQEIAGYRDALNLMHESALHMPFSANMIRQMHSILYRYLPQNGAKQQPDLDRQCLS